MRAWEIATVSVGMSIAMSGCAGQAVRIAVPAGLTVPMQAASLVAVLTQPMGTPHNTLEFVDTTGVVSVRVPLPDNAEAVAAAGARVLIAGGGTLNALQKDGSLETLGQIPNDGANAMVRGLVASPGGSQWAWSVVQQSDNGTAHSQIYVGGTQQPTRVLATRDDAGRATIPIQWSTQGIVVGDEPLGIGGYTLFRRTFGATSLMDPQSGVRTPLTPESCAFNDIDSRGDVACVVGSHEAPPGSGPITLRVTSPSNEIQEYQVPSSAAQAGAAYFSADGKTVSLAYSPVLANGAEQINLQTVMLNNGNQTTFNNVGLTPNSWLSDGRMLAYRQNGVAGGVVGTYIVDTTGHATLLSSASTIVGVLQ